MNGWLSGGRLNGVIIGRTVKRVVTGLAFFPESFSEPGFTFRFRGPGVGARPCAAEPPARSLFVRRLRGSCVSECSRAGASRATGTFIGKTRMFLTTFFEKIDGVSNHYQIIRCFGFSRVFFVFV